MASGGRVTEPYVALITGASAGIGEATARRLARDPGTELVLVARREDRLNQLAGELPVRSTVITLDLTKDDAPTTIRDALDQQHGGRLHLLVNNAGAAWRGSFADTGWANVERHLKLNLEAPLKLTHELLLMLRSTAKDNTSGRRVAIVNVASTAARVSRPNSGAYSVSKFAIAAWSDALHNEEAPHSVHVGTVLPGFVKTEGFPAAELLANPMTRWIVSSPERVAEAIVETGPGGKAERYVPRPYWLAAALRILAPGLIRRGTAGGAFTTATSAKTDD
jgi:short-subunit dehydrogenase